MNTENLRHSKNVLIIRHKLINNIKKSVNLRYSEQLDEKTTGKAIEWTISFSPMFLKLFLINFF